MHWLRVSLHIKVLLYLKNMIATLISENLSDRSNECKREIAIQIRSFIQVFYPA